MKKLKRYARMYGYLAVASFAIGTGIACACTGFKLINN